MRGDEVIENGTVLITGDRISAVGPTASISYPAGTRTIDVTGKTIIPGLIDAHWHGPMGSDLIIPKQNWVHAAGLAYGVTTVHDPSNDTREIFAASEYQKAGLILAPRIFSTGPSSTARPRPSRWRSTASTTPSRIFAASMPRARGASKATTSLAASSAR